MKTLNQLLAAKLSEPFWRNGQRCFLSNSTKAIYYRKLRPFLALYGEMPICDIPVSAYADWFIELEKKHREGNLAIVRAKMCALLNYAVKKDLLERNPLEDLRTYRDTPEQIIPATQAQVSAILTACGEFSTSANPLNRRDAAIMVFGVGGLRPVNLGATSLSRTIAAFDNPRFSVEQGAAFYVVPVGGSGNKQGMECILLESDRDIVERWLEVRPFTSHDALFINMNSDENTNHGRYLAPLTKESMAGVRRRICSYARIPLVSFKKLRVRVGTLATDFSGSTEDAAAVLGHSPVSGGRVVRGHYRDPNKERARQLALQVRNAVQSTPIEVDLTEQFQQIETSHKKISKRLRA